MNVVYNLATFVPFSGREDATEGKNGKMAGVKNNKNNVNEVVEQDLSDRMILSLVFDVTQLSDDIEQVKVCIYGLARQRGLVKSD